VVSTFETPGPLVIAVRVPAGSISIETTDGPQTEVELEPLDRNAAQVIEEATVELRRRGDGHELVVEIEERRFLVFSTAPRVNVRIRCPHGASLDVKSVSADVRGNGTFGGADVKSVSGDITLPDVERDARLKSVSGDVRMDRVGGLMEVQTVSGDVTGNAVGGNVSITTVSGDIRLDEADGSVTTKTVSGDQVVGAVRGGATCQSVSGDVFVAIPRGLQVYIDANSRSGDVTSDLDPSDGDLAVEGGQVAELRIKTMSGDIRIARA
jgi:Putative adhesin